MFLRREFDEIPALEIDRIHVRIVSSGRRLSDVARFRGRHVALLQTKPPELRRENLACSERGV